uniref:RRM domain-containing protein n=1 Tax=Oryza rufipogon TaxID=4529 RepID=A0A0E0PGF3_ORYRU
MATKPRRRSPSLSSSSSTSYSRSPASPSSSPSRSRSPPRPAGGARSPSPPPPPPPPRKASPPPESTVLHVDHLSRNVNEDHLKEIFENYGEVVNVELSMDRVVNLPRGYGYVEFKNRADAEKALLYLDDSRFHHSSKELLLLQKLFTLHQKGMWLIIIKLVLVLKRPPNSSPGNHLLKESQLHLQEGDLLQVEELNHLGVGLILLQFAVEQLLLQSGMETRIPNQKALTLSAPSKTKITKAPITKKRSGQSNPQALPIASDQEGCSEVAVLEGL